MDFANLFKGQKIEMDCPGCSQEFSAPAEKVMKPGSFITCPHCKQEIEISHTDDSAKDAQKALNDLEKTLKKFGK